MRKFYVLTDTTASVEKKYREELDFDYLPMLFTLENKTYDADLDWKEIGPTDYYNKMRAGNRITTGLIKATEVERKVEEAFKKGLDVLYVACSSKLSGSVKNASLLAEEVLKKYPERRLVCLDTLRSCYAQGLMAIDAAKMANEGASIDECVAKLEEAKLNYQVYATVGTLEWLRLAGRVKASKAFFGNLMGVKPIVVSDANGNNYGFKKTKGRLNSLNELVDICCTRVFNPEEATIFVEHADSLKDAEYVAAKIKERINPKCINISDLGPIVGSTTGPDTICVSFYGEKVEIVSGE